MCPASPNDDQCTTCAKNSCCAELRACAADAECVALINCIGNCMGDMTCGQMCLQQHPNGIATLQPFAQCLQDNCSADCM
jgi:hypothetical protein